MTARFGAGRMHGDAQPSSVCSSSRRPVLTRCGCTDVRSIITTAWTCSGCTLWGCATGAQMQGCAPGGCSAVFQLHGLHGVPEEASDSRINSMVSSRWEYPFSMVKHRRAFLSRVKPTAFHSMVKSRMISPCLEKEVANG